jgi:hypothetical protein
MTYSELTWGEILFGLGMLIAGFAGMLRIPSAIAKGGVIEMRQFLPGFAALYALPAALRDKEPLAWLVIVANVGGIALAGYGLSLRAPAPPNPVLRAERDASQPAPIAATAPSPRERRGPVPLLGPRAIAHRHAFALAADDDGALLAWAEPLASGGAIRAQALSPLGAVTGAMRDMATTVATVRELVAARAGERVAVAWVSTDGRRGTAHVALSSAVDAPSRTFELGDVDPLATYRIGLAPLPDGSFVIVAHTGSAARVAHLAEGRLRTSALSLSAPCERAVLGAMGTDDGALVVLCEAHEGGSTWVRARFGAHAQTPTIERTPSACADVAFAAVDGEPWRIERCDGVHVTRDDARRTALEARDACVEGRPLVLAQARHATAVAQLFPSAIVPEHARAVWTGQALLVAAPDRQELVARRWQCEADRLVRTDAPW